MDKVIASVIFTGFFTLTAVIITWLLTEKREKSKFISDFKLYELNELKSLYTEIISTLNKAMRYIVSGKDYTDLHDEHSLISAKANLFATVAVNEQFSVVSNLILDYSIRWQNRPGMPVGNTMLRFLTSEDKKGEEEIKELHKRINIEIGKLVELIKIELENQKRTILK